MAKQFLSDEQVKVLDQKEWNVIPNCAFIKLYKDEHKPQHWLEYSKILGFDPTKQIVKVLAVGTSK